MLKKKADQHTQRCYGAYFTCIDCSKTFNGNEYRQHTQCITEDEKYQKKLYKGPKKQQQNQQKPAQKTPAPVEPVVESKPITEKKTNEKKSKKNDKVEKPKLDITKYKGEKLYKVLKKLSKDDKKDLLKKIQITKDGNLELKV